MKWRMFEAIRTWHSKTRSYNASFACASSACLQHAFNGRKVQAIMHKSTAARQVFWQHTRDANKQFCNAGEAKTAGHGPSNYGIIFRRLHSNVETFLTQARVVSVNELRNTVSVRTCGAEHMVG